MDRKCRKNGAFTAVYRAYTARFRSVLSGGEIRTVLYPYGERTVFDRFPEFYG